MGVIVIAAASLLAAAAPAAAATTYCVGVDHPGCVVRPTAAEAFDDAADGDRIELGELTATAALDDTGRALEVMGAGEGVTVLAGGLTLSDPASAVTAATIAGLDLAGSARQVRVEGTAALHDGALLSSAAVTDSVDAADGVSRLETVVLDATAGPGLHVACAARLDARHVTVAGTPDAAVTTACADSEAHIADGILWAPFDGPGTVVTSFSDYPAIAGRTDGPGDRHVDPGFAPGSPRLAAGSPLLDAGTPERAGRERVARGPRRACRASRTATATGSSRAIRARSSCSRPPCRSRPATCCATRAPRRAARGSRRTASRASATERSRSPRPPRAPRSARAPCSSPAARRPRAAPRSAWT